MRDNDVYYYDGELYHHGIAGQKWGVQNGPPYPLQSNVSKSNAKRKTNTGSLASKVKEKAKSAVNSVKSAVSSRREKNQQQSSKKRNASKMTDDELKKAINRLNLEQQYNSAYDRAHPEKVSVGKKFLNSAGQVVSNSVKTAAQDSLTKTLKNALNKSDSDPDAALKKEVDHLKLESQKATYTANIQKNSSAGSSDSSKSTSSSSSSKKTDSSKSSNEKKTNTNSLADIMTSQKGTNLNTYVVQTGKDFAKDYSDLSFATTKTTFNEAKQQWKYRK